MITSALLLMLTTSTPRPGFLVDGAPRRIRLVSDEVEAQPGYPGWTHSELKAEYERLESIRPGLALPITLMAGGGGVFVIDAYFLLLAGLGSGLGGGGISIPAMVAFGVVGIVGAGLLIMGVIFLSRILPERRAISRQMDELDGRLNGSDEDTHPARRAPEPDPMAPPPPPPPAAMPPPQVMMPASPITLARF